MFIVAALSYAEIQVSLTTENKEKLILGTYQKPKERRQERNNQI